MHDDRLGKHHTGMLGVDEVEVQEDEPSSEVVDEMDPEGLDALAAAREEEAEALASIAIATRSLRDARDKQSQ
eukprot:11461188-Alexandrium_andersonii.AAC.1